MFSLVYMPIILSNVVLAFGDTALIWDFTNVFKREDFPALGDPRRAIYNVFGFTGC